MQNISYLILLILSEFLIILVSFFIHKKNSSTNQVKTIFNWILICMSVWTLSLILQISLQNSTIAPVFFESFSAFRCMLYLCVFAFIRFNFL